VWRLTSRLAGCPAGCLQGRVSGGWIGRHWTQPTHLAQLPALITKDATIRKWLCSYNHANSCCRDALDPNHSSGTAPLLHQSPKGAVSYQSPQVTKGAVPYQLFEPACSDNHAIHAGMFLQPCNYMLQVCMWRGDGMPALHA
jgi:hypothetical protein